MRLQRPSCSEARRLHNRAFRLEFGLQAGAPQRGYQVIADRAAKKLVGLDSFRAEGAEVADRDLFDEHSGSLGGISGLLGQVCGLDGFSGGGAVRA